MKMLSLSVQRLLDFCFPPRCIVCRAPLERQSDALCPGCQLLLRRAGEEDVRTGLHFRSCRFPFFYTDRFKSSFHRYKFQGCWHYSHYYGRWMWECLREREPDWQRFSCVTWVPLSLRRYLRRGYNQSARLAREVSRLSGLPCRPLLRKKRHTPAQSGTERAAERWDNVRGVYALRRGGRPEGQSILLVDDIITTGATLESACSVLENAGAAEICCLTLAGSVGGAAEGTPDSAR